MAEEMLLCNIGKRISRYRNRIKYSQDTLADKMGVARGTISRWEKGERAIHITEIARLAKILRVSTEEILTGFKPKNVSIHQATGLSERAIAVLREAVTYEWEQPARFINLLLEYANLDEIWFDFQKYHYKKAGMPKYEEAENYQKHSDPVVKETLKQLYEKIIQTDLGALEYSFVQSCIYFLKHWEEKREWVAVELEKGENLRTNTDY